MIKLRDLCKDWKDFSIQNVNLDVNEGEYFVTLGPTGAGKTLLLELIAGFHFPDKGAIWLNGRDVTYAPPEERNIGFVYQDYMLFPHLTVSENIKFGLKAKKKERIDEKADEVMDTLGISHLAHRYPETLSGGEGQKVAMARAISTDPDVLLLDEPLAALDPLTKTHLMDELKLINESGVTIVHVTHDQMDAMILAEKVAIMMDGEIQQVGHVDEVFHRPKDEDIARFVGMENVFSGYVKSNESGLALIDTGSFDILALTGKKGSVKVFIRPEDITLSLYEVDSSARNVIRGRIVEMTNVGPMVRVQLDKGLTAIITRMSAEDFNLKVGKIIYAHFKTTAVHVI